MMRRSYTPISDYYREKNKIKQVEKVLEKEPAVINTSVTNNKNTTKKS